ncbi:MAG TPA: cation-transporting P-type ATPase [Gemmatimonadales bacterium]|nr:cation-transporting P-type ATPase [Gemmatimonadales bacterium]
MRIQRLSVTDALRSLRSDAQGLSSAEALRRMEEYGPNIVQEIRGQSLAVRFLKQFTHFFALILWVAAALAFVVGRNQPAGGMATLGYAILGVIFVNGAFSFWQEYRAERAIAALRRLLPQHAKVLRDGKLTDIPARQLVPGDVLLLEEGDVVPADCRLLEGAGIQVNAAAITGESVPLSRTAAPSEDDDVIRATNVLLAGTSLVRGQGRALAFATGMHTEFGKIAGLTQMVVEPPTPLQGEIVRLSRLVAIISTSLGVIFFTIGQVLGLPFWGNLTFAIGIIVANVPEGLLPTVTLALAAGARRMARRNALVRHLPSVEALGAVTVICTDKTGTLTTNRMTVRRLYLSGRFLDDGPQVARAVPAGSLERRLFEAARLCHDLKSVERDGRTQLLGDPMEAALVESAAPVVPDLVDGGRLDEIPFDGDRKRLAVLHRTPDGALLYVKGALETILPLCRKVVHEAGTRDLTPEAGAQILAAQHSLAGAGLRVLAFAYRPVAEPYERDALESDLILSGLIGLEDPPRPEVPDAIRRCREAGIRVIMITGDHPSTAVAIGREIGLFTSPEPLVYRGEDLRRVSDTQLQLALDAPEIVFARVNPDQKMRIVSVLKRKGAIVAATGDGVNDAPALRQADVGIAMGLTGTEVAREAADIVLADDNFASIVNAVEEGRTVFANIRKFLTYILTSNVPELIPYLAFVLLRIPLALTIVQILAVDLGTDLLPALALGAERPDPQVMRLPPRARTGRLLDATLLTRAYLFLGLLEAAAAMTTFFFVLTRGGWSYGQQLAPDDPLYLQATTATLCAIIVAQVANVFLCRSETRSAFRLGLLSNPLILGGILGEVLLILAIVYLPVGHRVFGTAPIPSTAWLVAAACAVGMFGLEELRKLALRRRVPA